MQDTHKDMLRMQIIKTISLAPLLLKMLVIEVLADGNRAYI